jgi:PAS domain S-box-containing protein
MEATITQSLTNTTPIEAIFDSVTEALLSVSESGLICNCNKICSRYFGLTKDQLIGSKIEHILPEAKGQTLDRFLTPFMPDLNDTLPHIEGGQVNAQRANGDSFVAEIAASQIVAGEGRIFVISLRDVTGRQQAESALKENEERYRALVENAPESIVVFDIDKGRLVDANDNACKLFNLSRQRLLSIGPEQISPEMQPDGLPSFGVKRGYVDRALAGEHPTFEWMHQDSAGREFPCEVRFSRLPSNCSRLIRASITNIQDRKRNESIAFAQNKILEMIAASTPYARTLRAICRCVEKINDDFRAAIMQMDARSKMLNLAQAPSVPEPFKLALDFVEVSEDGITCAAAAYRGEDQFTTDLSKSPAWREYAGTAAMLAGDRERWGRAGDQLYVDLDLGEDNLPPGARLRIGSVVLEISAKPHRGCAKFAARFGADALRLVSSERGRAARLRGVNARVVTGGTARVGDAVEKTVVAEIA